MFIISIWSPRQLFECSTHWKKQPKHFGFIFHSKELCKLIDSGGLKFLAKSLVEAGMVVSFYDKNGLL
jgi:hypothetical protein